MRPDTLLSYARAVPIRPFRLTMNSGRAFDVRHPEMIRVGRDAFNFYHANPPPTTSTEIVLRNVPQNYFS